MPLTITPKVGNEESSIKFNDYVGSIYSFIEIEALANSSTVYTEANQCRPQFLLCRDGQISTFISVVVLLNRCVIKIECFREKHINGMLDVISAVKSVFFE